MILLIQSVETAEKRAHEHLNSIMILLIRKMKTLSIINLKGFKFHYDSINSITKML